MSDNLVILTAFLAFVVGMLAGAAFLAEWLEKHFGEGE